MAHQPQSNTSNQAHWTAYVGCILALVTFFITFIFGILTLILMVADFVLTHQVGS